MDPLELFEGLIELPGDFAGSVHAGEKIREDATGIDHLRRSVPRFQLGAKVAMDFISAGEPLASAASCQPRVRGTPALTRASRVLQSRARARFRLAFPRSGIIEVTCSKSDRHIVPRRPWLAKMMRAATT